LRIDPCIPAEWYGFEVLRKFRSKMLNIKVLNPSGVEKGVKSITLNGINIKGNIVRFNIMSKHNNIKVIMG